jgi:hypothetical protein
MMLLVPAVVTFVCAWSLHLAWWRVHRPRRPYRALVGLFLMTGLAGALLAWCCGVQLGWLEAIYGMVLYGLAALGYLITYSAIEGDSPTLSLVWFLHQAGPEGVTAAEMEEFFRRRPFASARIRALVDDGVLHEEEGGLRLRSRTPLLFGLVLGYRRLVFGPVDAGG